ncbi:MAG: amidase, partial [Chloroflexi bacterium]|nr:amidase [Chloroflexota bacterium]
MQETSISELQTRMATGELTAVGLAETYLRRIAELDQAGPALHAVIEVNPDALAIAASLDAEREAQEPRGPLHGIPVLLKDNIDTADKMMTTAGSLALAGSIAAQDSTVAAKLRAAGAIILGKVNCDEFGMGSSTERSAFKKTRNPWDPSRVPGGSSGGSAAAVSAALCTASLGTDTGGSIRQPAAFCGVVGIKPT